MVVPAGIEPDGQLRGSPQTLHRIGIGAVVLKRDVGRQGLLHLRRRRDAGKARGLLALDHQIGLKHRIVRDVAAAQVGHPGNFIEFGED